MVGFTLLLTNSSINIPQIVEVCTHIKKETVAWYIESAVTFDVQLLGTMLDYTN